MKKNLINNNNINKINYNILEKKYSDYDFSLKTYKRYLKTKKCFADLKKNNRKTFFITNII